MKMITVYSFFLALTLSIQAIAFEPAYTPPFNSFVCKSSSRSIQVQLKRFRQTYDSGPALIHSNSANWLGGWTWEKTDETLLTGNISLKIKALSQDRLGSIYIYIFYTPQGKLARGWLTMRGVSEPVKCDVI